MLLLKQFKPFWNYFLFFRFLRRGFDSLRARIFNCFQYTSKNDFIQNGLTQRFMLYIDLQIFCGWFVVWLWQVTAELLLGGSVSGDILSNVKKKDQFILLFPKCKRLKKLVKFVWNGVPIIQHQTITGITKKNMILLLV